MANRFPAFQLYPNDWLGSLNRKLMTLQEQGAYFNLLCHYWNSGCSGIPNDPEKLRLLADWDEKLDGAWTEAMAKLSRCFVTRRGKWHNEKLYTIRPR